MILEQLIRESKKRIEENSNSDFFSGVPSGFSELDKLTYGWQPSELITFGGRAGMGKTSFALTMARNIAVDFNIPIQLFSIESSSVAILNKLISLETKISIEKLRSGSLEKHEWEQLNVYTKKLEKAPLYIDDSPAISIEKLIVKIRQAYEEEEIKIVIIDYLQLIEIDDKNVKASNREQCVSIIVKKLKAISKELAIPIILLSQLNRALEERGGSKRPILYDLRDSGAIEDDSDIVGFIYRPEYYKIDEWDDDERTPCEGQVELIIAKNRNGGLENIRLKFIKNLGMFDNLDKFDTHFEFQTKIGANEENPFLTKNLPSTDEAFGSSLNNGLGPEDDNDVPF